MNNNAQILQNIKHPRWCANHPISPWGTDKDGEFYKHCRHGFIKEEDCEIGKDEEVTENE